MSMVQWSGPRLPACVWIRPASPAKAARTIAGNYDNEAPRNSVLQDQLWEGRSSAAAHFPERHRGECGTIEVDAHRAVRVEKTPDATRMAAGRGFGRVRTA